MSVQFVQLGTPRQEGEGLRIGTVRRPPRGVPKAEFASRNYYDVWYPELSPEPELMHMALQSHKIQAEGNAEEAAKLWAQFDKQFRKQLNQPSGKHTLELLAALSHGANFSVGCYCEDERRCHRSILRSLLKEHGALIAS